MDPNAKGGAFINVQGLSCITSAEGAISDIIKDCVNGLIAERKDAYSLAEKNEMLLNDSQKRWEMGKEGCRMLNEHFTLDVFERRMCKILNGIAL